VKTDEHLSEKTMAELIKQGDLKEFTVLYNTYAAALLGVIQRITGEQTISENIFQQTFIELWNTKQTYSPSKERIFTWMFKTARKLAIETVRSQSDLNSSINSLVYSKEAEDFLTCRNKSMCMQEEVMQALRLIYFKAYTIQDAAHELDITINDLQSKLKLAIEHLNAVIA